MSNELEEGDPGRVMCAFLDQTAGRVLCQGGVPGLLLQCREEERVAVGLVWLVKTEDWKTTARSMRGDRERKRVMGFNLIPEGTSL